MAFEPSPIHPLDRLGAHLGGARCTEIRALGYTGCDTTVRALLHPFRTLGTVPLVTLGPPKVREVTAWTLRPAQLTAIRRAFAQLPE